MGTKDVIGLFVSVKEEPKVEEPAPVEEVAEAEPEEDADAKKKKKKRRRPPSKLAVFSTLMSRLWWPLKRLPSMKTPHSIEKKDNMKQLTTICLIQTILSAGVRL